MHSEQKTPELKFDPRFKENFFTAQEEKSSADTISFPIPPAKNLKKFQASHDGEKFRAGIHVILHQIANWAKDNGFANAPEELEHFYTTIFDYRGSNTEYNAIILPLLQSAPRVLTAIATQLRNETIPITRRKDI